ncbi:hypothetical protein [Tannockella kyphosi]|uniref:hypothetical protein n=1 Tax=Tannockella kyphosi TaxID=2899121 RepID=UPI002012712A|nr:hypothetical protein [Tannockella kyphosi]
MRKLPNYINENAKYNNRYVAFIDILGFKELILKTDFRNITSVFDKITHEIFCFDSTLALSIGIPKYSQINTYIMSDSVVLSIDVDAPQALIALVKATAYIQTALIKRNPSILSRGGISIGEYYQERDKAFGSALVKAHQLESCKDKGKGAIFPRVIFDNDICLEQIKESIILDDYDGLYFVDYLKVALKGSSFQSFIKEDISKKQLCVSDNKIKEKYDWYEKYYKLSMDKIKKM